MSLFRWLALLLFALLPFSLHAQQQLVDSLQQVVNAHPEEDTTRVRLLSKMAFAYSNTDPQQCRELAEDIRVLSRNLGYRRGELVSYQLTGISHAVQGEYDLALNSFVLALDLSRELKDSTIIGKNLSNIGGIYYSQNNFIQAEKYSREALAVIVQQGDKAAIATTSLGLAVVQERLGKYEEALDRYQEALEAFKVLGEDLRMASTYMAIGKLYKSQKDYPRAMHFIKKSMDVRKRIEDKVGEINTLLALGKLYMELEALDKAESSLKESEGQALELRLNHTLVGIYEALTELERKRGDYQSAFDYQQKYIQYHDSVFKASTTKELEQLKMGYEMGKRKQEAELLKKDKELELAWRNEGQERLRSQQIINGTFVLLVVSMLVLSISLYLNRQNIKKANELLLIEKEENEEKRRELEELNKTKDQWFSMMCHDFKQPFSFLQGALGLIHEGELSEQEKQLLISEMKERVSNHSQMLDNLLFWAQDQQNGIVVRKEQLDMESLINENIFLLESASGKKNIDIQNDVGHHAQVLADRNMIHLVVRNLLDNAVKLSQSHEKVRVNCDRSDGFLCFHIADSGMSIPEEYLEKLFQVDSRRVLEAFAKERGLGINLLVSRDFVEKNGGEIWVRNAAGKGNIFSFSLPIYGAKQKGSEQRMDKDFESMFDS